MDKHCIVRFTVATPKDMTPNPLHRHRYTESVTPKRTSHRTHALPYYPHVILIHRVTLLPQSYPITPMLSLYIVLPYYPNVTLLPSCYPYT